MLKLLRDAFPRNPVAAVTLTAAFAVVGLVFGTMASEISYNGCVLGFMAIMAAFWAGQLEGS